MAGIVVGMQGHVVFNNFHSGEAGLLNPVETGPVGRPRYWAEGRSGFFTGQNVIVLPNGEIGPRADPQPQATVFPAFPGPIVELGPGYDGARGIVWYKAGNKIFQSNGAATYTFVALGGTSPTTTAYLDRCQASDATFAVTDSNLVDRIDHAAVTVAGLAGSPPLAATICVYGERLMLGGAGGDGNKLYFSAPDDFASWPGNYIIVGDRSPIVALVATRAFLLIVKAGGPDDSWFVLRGVPGVNAVVRRASKFATPAHPAGITELSTNTVAFGVETPLTASFIEPVGGGSTPAQFNGSIGTRTTYLADLLHADPLLSSPPEALHLADGDDLVLWDAEASKMLLRLRGMWTFHDMGALALADGSAGTNVNTAPVSRTIAVDASGTAITFLDQAGTTMLKWRPYALRPADGTDVAAPDPATVFFSLPEWWVPWGDEVSVRAVMVDFTKYPVDDEITQACSFSVQAVSLGKYPHGDESSSPLMAFSVTGSGSTDGTRARETFSFANDFGNGFRIDFSNLRAVTIRAVTVITNTRPIVGI